MAWAVLALSAGPASAVLPPNFGSLSNTERARLSHLLAAHFPAAWNARTLAMPGQAPTILVADEWGNGQPAPLFGAKHYLDAAVVGGQIDHPSALTPSNHGYHVMGIALGSFANDGTAPGMVTGAFSKPGKLFPYDLTSQPALRNTLTSFADLVNSIPGHVVINTSRGENGTLASEAEQWIDAVRGHSLESRVFHVTAAGNDGRVGGQAVEASPFAAAALNPNLPNHPPLTNTLVAENVEEKGDASALACLSATSNSGGSIAAPGHQVWSFTKTGGAENESGTSMATPLVAGLAAYLWSIAPSLTPQQLVSAITMNPQPGPEAGCSRPSAPLLDAYAATLSLDQSGPPTIAGYPVRMAILNVDGQPGFKAKDMEILANEVNTDKRNWSRFDLNGDGFTGGPKTAPFDLDRSDSTRAGQTGLSSATDEHGGTYEEKAVTDADVLCFYAYSPLYTGSTMRRTEVLQKLCGVPFGGKFAVCTQVCPATVSFSLTHNGTEVHHWAWGHIPVDCAEGPDVASSNAPYRIDVRVVNHHFHAQGVRDPEGFRTTLDGTLNHNDTKATGTLTMTGPEPPTSTHCHGTDHWSATAQ